MAPTALFLAALIIIAAVARPASARRGALVRDGMTTKNAYNNPNLEGGITGDRDVVAITTRCSKWAFDPVDVRECASDGGGAGGHVAMVPREVFRSPLHVTFRGKSLGSKGKRPNWMRAAATCGDPAVRDRSISRRPSLPLRAVWTCASPETDESMTLYDATEAKSPRRGGGGRAAKKTLVGKDVLGDGYEECLRRLYGKYVELEVLLPSRAGTSSSGGAAAAPPASLVYRVPITVGSVNPAGMVSRSRATVTLYPNGRTIKTAGGQGEGTGDVAVALGKVNVHVPTGPGLVDSGWARGRRVFWKGRTLGLV